MMVNLATKGAAGELIELSPRGRLACTSYWSVRHLFFFTEKVMNN